MSNKKKELIIGSRGSQLALWQANHIADRLQAAYHGLTVNIIKIKTQGDKVLDVPLAKVGGKGLFVKELEDALLAGRIDLAVHSMKDVPTELPEGLTISATTEREDVRDALIASSASSLQELPSDAVIGTSSLRRQSQLLNYSPKFRIVQLRGNLDTRLRKLKEQNLDAIILAAAGVCRLGLQDRVTQYLPVGISLPAVGQGSLGIETRSNDEEVNQLIAYLNHFPSEVAVKAERAFLTRLEGGCQVPIGAYAQLAGNKVVLQGLIADVDGSEIIRCQIEGDVGQEEQLGTELAERLLSLGGREILDKVYSLES